MAGAFWCIVEDDRQGMPKKVMSEALGEAGRLSGGNVEAVWLTDKASDIRQTVVPGGFDPVNPNAAEATTEVPGHEALAATDKGSNTFWAEAADGDGTGQAITIRFPAAFSLAKVGIFPGRSGADGGAGTRSRAPAAAFTLSIRSWPISSRCSDANAVGF